MREKQNKERLFQIICQVILLNSLCFHETENYQSICTWILEIEMLVVILHKTKIETHDIGSTIDFEC